MDKPKVLKLYKAGLSTRQIGAALGFSPSYVHRICQEAGITRGRAEAAILRQPAASKHWRSARCAARSAWRRAFGSIPKGMVVHHKDADYMNNSPENLQLMTSSEHAKLHHPKNPIPRRLRPGRKEYSQNYYRTKVMSDFGYCLQCGKEFYHSKYEPQLTCSHRCGSLLAWRRRNASAKA